VRPRLPAVDMTGGALISLLLHGLFGIGMWMATRNIVMPLPDLTADEAVDIDFVTVDEVTRVKEAARPSIAAAPRETVEAASTPDTVRTPDVTQREGLPDPAAVPLPASKGAGDRLDTRKLADLIDKSLAKADRKTRQFDDLAKSLERDLPSKAVLSPAEAATLVQYMQARITECFSMPSGAESLDRMRVTLRIVLDAKGAVVGVPEIAEQKGMTAENSGFFRAFTESTRRAILRCQPYNLPPASFEHWREQDISFNPRDLAR
jgi:hypothetical protein